MAHDEAVRLTPTAAIANFILLVEDDEEEARVPQGIPRKAANTA